MWDLSNSEIKIIKDEKGTYRTNISRKDRTETGDEITDFMKVLIGFKKGTEVLNRSKIRINKGFPTFIKIKSKEYDSNGNEKEVTKRFIKFMITDFEVIEQGIVENEKIIIWNDNLNTFQKQEQQPVKKETIGEMFFGESDDLPF